MRFSDDELLEEIRRLYREEGKVTTKLMDKKGSFSSRNYYDRFGSWNYALKEAGVPLNKRFDITKEELLDEIRRLSDGKRPPSIPQMNDEGKFCAEIYKERFETWNKAVSEAGFQPRIVARGEEHYNWKEDSVKNYGESWSEQRRKCWERDSYSCRVCNSDCGNRNPDVHHIKPVSFWEVEEEHEDMNDLKNLVSLCRECHMKFEGSWVEEDVVGFIEKCSRNSQRKTAD